MPQSQPTSTTSVGIRVAAIEIRAVDDKQYTALVDAYTKYSGSTKPIAINNGVSFESGNKEVRIVHNTNLDKQNFAVVYWEVKGATIGDIRTVYQDWINTYHYQRVEEPKQDGALEDTSKEHTYSGLVKDSNGYQVGLVINPPYPRITEELPHTGPYLPWEHNLSAQPLSWWLLILALLLSLLLGIWIGRRVKKTVLTGPLAPKLPVPPGTT